MERDYLNHSQIEQDCRDHFRNKGSLQSYEVLSGGAVNATYKICWDNEWYVLRYYLRDIGSSPYLEYCLAHLIPGSNAWMRLGDAQAKLVIRFIEERREFFPVVQDGGCLVHSDFKPVNLLWNKEGGVTVLDWEFAHSGDGIMDFGILLRHFHDVPLSIPHLVNGYRDNGGHLPSGWIQRARITDVVNIVQLLDSPEDRPKLYNALRQTLALTMTRWDKLEEVVMQGEDR